MQLLLSEKNLIVREEACRNGLLLGGFTGIYHAARCALRHLRGTDGPVHAFVAGALAGVSVFALDDPSKRRILALYLLARVAQCAYNSAEGQGKLRGLGTPAKHGSTFLFALASAQVMYGFVMRPETLPASYVDFVTKTGPIAEPVIKAVRSSCRGQPVDVPSLAAYVRAAS
eukprot:SM002423S08223  [mRNA]  locus=s2423:750:1780:+ [translate_table: standard]